MKCAFITGSSKGIGKAIAVSLLDKNYIVFGISRTHGIQHPNFKFLQTDLSDRNQLLAFEFPDEVFEKFVLVNNAGSLGEMKRIGSLDNENILNTYILNVAAPHILMNKFIEKYRKRDAEKVIINISSGAANSEYDGWSVYCASKAALNKFTEVGDVEQSISDFDFPFKIFAIAPGVVETSMQKTIRAADTNDFSRKNKFIDLYEKNELLSPAKVGKEFARLIENTSLIESTLYRISL